MIKVKNSEKTLMDLSKVVSKLQTERNKLFKRIGEINREVKAVETTMRLMGYKNGKSILTTYEELVNRIIRKKNKVPQLEVLNEIVDTIGDENRIFKVNEAKNIMVSAGMFNNPENANSTIYTLIDRSNEFEKVKPGVYRIIDNASPSPSISPTSSFKTTFTVGDETLKENGEDEYED